MYTKPVIYILTNPSFPQFVKIRYSDDIESRVTTLNNNPDLPLENLFRLESMQG